MHKSIPKFRVYTRHRYYTGTISLIALLLFVSVRNVLQPLRTVLEQSRDKTKGICAQNRSVIAYNKSLVHFGKENGGDSIRQPHVIGESHVWMEPKVSGVEPPRSTTVWDVTTESGRVARRKCVQDHLFGILGLDTLKEYFLQGCNVPALYDFGNWSMNTGCGIEPIQDTLLLHTAWTGPYNHVRQDLDALMDSFLMTQNTSSAKLIFWILDAEPNSTDPFQNKYSDVDSIEFRKGDLADAAIGTFMEGNKDFIDLDWPSVKKGPRWKANIFRVLVCHKYGGIWVDTDTVLLRDLRPLFEFAGEFATKLTMSLYYNNNFMGLRKGSLLGARMIRDIVATPYNSDSKAYCRHVGNPCYPKWTWNHGLIQMSVREKRGIVIFPTQFSDPAYGCFPPWLLGASGGFPMRDYNIDEVLEFIRGAFVLHTRAYKTDKPVPQNSNYGRIYNIVSKGAKASHCDPVPVVHVHRRTDVENAALAELFERRGEYDNIVDPPFLPRTPRVPVLLKNEKFKSCVDAVRHVKKSMYGGNPELYVTGNCSRAKSRFNETVVFLWHRHGGYLRPAHKEPGRVLCVDALPISAQPMRNTDTVLWTTSPKMLSCNPTRPTQQWEYDTTRMVVKNPHTALCMETVLGEPNGPRLRVVMRMCDGSAAQRFHFEPYTGAMPY